MHPIFLFHNPSNCKRMGSHITFFSPEFPARKVLPVENFEDFGLACVDGRTPDSMEPLPNV